MVLGTYFVVSLKSSIDISLKKRMVINMTILLVLSFTEYYFNFLKEESIYGLSFVIVGITYYSLKPLVMATVISMVEPKNKLIYIPAIFFFIFYCHAFYVYKAYHLGLSKKLELEVLACALIIADVIYWCIFFFILNMKFYRKNNINSLGIFFFLTWLMTANILDFMGVHKGLLVETYALGFLFFYLIKYVHISQQVNEEKEIKLREQRVSLMLSQIQPHFLYNTLNTITALCRSNPKLAEETTINFSKYLRENMYSMGENDTHPFCQELDHTNIYLDIEKLRFGNRVKVEYDIKADDFDMPILTLQPIVENAVKHGICKKIEGGTVKIATEKKGRDYIITITDDGVGFELETALNDGKPHIGIQNVNERLRSTVKAEMKITSFIGIGTTVKITIPGEKKSIKTEGGERREILSIGR